MTTLSSAAPHIVTPNPHSRPHPARRRRGLWSTFWSPTSSADFPTRYRKDLDKVLLLGIFRDPPSPVVRDPDKTGQEETIRVLRQIERASLISSRELRLDSGERWASSIIAHFFPQLTRLQLRRSTNPSSDFFSAARWPGSGRQPTASAAHLPAAVLSPRPSWPPCTASPSIRASSSSRKSFSHL